MTSKPATGHARNVANFSQMISFVSAHGEAYNPSNQLIMLPALQTLFTAADGSLGTVNNTLSEYNSAIATRRQAYQPLGKLVTRTMSQLAASGISTTSYNQVRTVARKIKGIRATAITETEAPSATTGNPPAANHISVAQLSFDSRVENFSKLVQLLSAITEYNPNEPELKINTLNAFTAMLKEANQAVTTARVAFSNARIARDTTLYAAETGLFSRSLRVKQYVKSVFGARSPQYRQISSLLFTKPR